ncbi:MAG: hypothetical protein OXN21_10280, partial [Chloroflexota bacterium]|nr:hypothetical protein [Chloroflexota bacterium]
GLSPTHQYNLVELLGAVVRLKLEISQRPISPSVPIRRSREGGNLAGFSQDSSRLNHDEPI